jgi:Vanadium chloroperoxidase N-terminal domain
VLIFTRPRVGFVADEVRRTGERAERMKHRLTTSLLVVAALVLSTFAALSGTTPAAAAPSGPRWPIKGYAPRASDNVILKWDEQLLSTIRAYPPQTGPTITARAIGVLHTATYDAWAAYDSVAKGTRLLGGLRQPESQRTGQVGVDNKKKAISFAAYRVLMDLFPPTATAPAPAFPSKPPTYYVPDVLMTGPAPAGLSYDPAETDSTPGVIDSPAEVGYAAADAVLSYRHGDRSNQLGGYVNTTVPYTVKNTWKTITDPWAWQSICVLTAAGVAANQPPVRDPVAYTDCPSPDYTEQKPLHPHWGTIKGFALDPATQMPPHFSVPGPPKLADGSYNPAEVDLALTDTSNLDAIRKARVEYWVDGPGSEFPPGHSMVFAQALSRMRSHTLDQDVKLFFMLGNAQMDASISAWKAKYDWDFVRPVTSIRTRYKDKQVTSWLGPNKGYGKVFGQNWMPYQALTVVTPAFPEYVSGHSTFTAAGRTILGGFGGDKFNAQVVITAGSQKFEANSPATDITLTWRTLTDAADDAGWSRRWGGIHFKSGDEHGRLLGKVVASDVWDKAQTYFNGTATAIT